MFPRYGKMFVKLTCAAIILMTYRDCVNTDPFPNLSDDPSDSEMLKTYKIDPGNPAKTSATWVTHLCPKYSHHTLPKHASLHWEKPGHGAIFFTQTSCSITLSPREACAVESAARHHPGRPVLVFMTAPSVDASQPLLKLVQQLDTVSLRWLDLDRVFASGPLEPWHRDRMWMLSEDRAPATVSDAVRAEMLRHFGGTYVDLDAITLRAFPRSPNWLGRVDQRLVTAAVSSFQRDHPLLKAAVAALPASYDPSACCSVGPDLLTDLLHQQCPDNITIPTSAPPEAAEYCGDVVVQPRTLFYPIHYGYEIDELESIFRDGEGLGPAFFSHTKTKDAFSLHLFHSLSRKRLVSLRGDSILKEAARRNCPKVYRYLLSQKDCFGRIERLRKLVNIGVSNRDGLCNKHRKRKAISFETRAVIACSTEDQGQIQEQFERY
ncbi:alpha-1,4-N-acetylglucosaminyltransferase-like [Penaeus japonicus]|uniref:alpha-1,4-N-acetylglucosaminyltransferase-like n=1 Tax=Penaeus japonicus TaxID=27405 RepID=UPI001C71608B|nr:alpha-1,4-N-acetylglucosaminyltransferase-like [Penaeus japonicus]